MNYQFDQLERLVTDIICPQHFVQQANKAAFVNKTVVLVHDESMRANGLLTHEFINCESEQQARHYVQQHQRAVVRLLNLVIGYENEIGKEKVGIKQAQSYLCLIQKAAIDLEYILNNLLANGSNYYNPDIAIPQALKLKYTAAVNKLQSKLSEFSSRGNIDIELLKIVSEPLTSFMSPGSAISFYDYNYLTAYVSNLNHLLDHTSINDDTICDFLQANNFNEYSFYNYYLAKITAGIPSESYNLSYLYLQLKKINQVQKKAVPPYNKDHLSILEQIGTWLSEEIYFLEKNQLYNSHTTTITAEKTVSEDKIDTKLSVSNLSLAVRLLVDTDIIKNKKLSTVIKMVAASFRTEKTEHISEGSLRNKVYNIESSSVETMKDIIINLLNAVKKY